MSKPPIVINGSRTFTRSETGILSASVTWWVEDPAEQLTVGEDTYLDVPETTRDGQQLEGSEFAGYNVTINYEGLVEKTGKAIYEWDSSFRESPIESHEDILILKQYYGGIVGADGKVKWPEKLPQNAGAGGGLTGGARNADLKNPLFGLTSYLVMGVIFRESMAVKEIPRDVLENVGKITQSIPGKFPTPDGRDWLVMSPKIRTRGNAFDLSREFMLSAPGGHPAPLHKLITI